MLGIDCLVTFFVALFRFAVQIGRKRDDPCVFYQFCKTDAAFPLEFKQPCVSLGFVSCGGKMDYLAVDA